jgi:hypothetical protein
MPLVRAALADLAGYSDARVGIVEAAHLVPRFSAAGHRWRASDQFFQRAAVERVCAVHL